VTAPALSPVLDSTVRLRAAASRATAPMLGGIGAEAVVLGSSKAAAWLAVDGDVLVLTTAGAVRLPNAVALGVAAEARPFAEMRVGDPVAVGGNCITAPGLTVEVVRWWDPRPRLAPASSQAVLGKIAEARARVAGGFDFGLGAALVSADPAAVVAGALLLLGRGRGLTPEGDDLLAAALASHRLIGEAVGTTAAGDLVDRVADELARAANERTTSLSASLLRLACTGNVADPVHSLLLALVDRADLAAAVDRVLGVGHSSGAALAHGVLVGAAAACTEVPG
jgi:hypothetical protein